MTRGGKKRSTLSNIPAPILISPFFQNSSINCTVSSFSLVLLLYDPLQVPLQPLHRFHEHHQSLRTLIAFDVDVTLFYFQFAEPFQLDFLLPLFQIQQDRLHMITDSRQKFHQFVLSQECPSTPYDRQ